MLYDIKKLILLRRSLHQNAEIGFEELKTQQILKDYLVSIGVEEKSIIVRAKTGLLVDIKGKGKTIDGPEKCVAFRADMDGLLMEENNQHLPYKSLTKAAHMCGHDGHMACLMGGISLILEIIDKVPSNRIMRILFQPGEEACGGALQMVTENCLAEVQEVWGLHNMPWDPIGKIFVKPGVMMASNKIVTVRVEGCGGHSSLKDRLKDPVLPAYKFAVKAENVLKKEFSEYNNKDIIFSLPKIDASGSANVFPNKAVISGTLRAFNKDVEDRFIQKLNEIASKLSLEYGVKISVDITYSNPITSNDEKLTQRLKDLFANMVIDRDLPVRVSEDFSEFSTKVPGCFFFIGIGSQAGPCLHSNNYDFNDEVIDHASNIWFEIMKDRLDVKE